MWASGRQCTAAVTTACSLSMGTEVVVFGGERYQGAELLGPMVRFIIHGYVYIGPAPNFMLVILTTSVKVALHPWETHLLGEMWARGRDVWMGLEQVAT